MLYPVPLIICRVSLICSCRNFVTCVPFDFAITINGMGDDMSAVASEVDYCILEQYTREYLLSLVLGFQVLSSSLSVLDAPPGKIGFYLWHLVCGLRLPSSPFFLEVLCYYKVHLVECSVKDCHFRSFCVSHQIPLDVSLFCYFFVWRSMMAGFLLVVVTFLFR